MTKRRKNTIPGITFHKATGQARVRLNGKDHYLGVYGSDEAQEVYHRVIAEWLARGRKLPNKPKRKTRRAPIAEERDTGVEVLTVAELARLHLEWAERRYTHSNQAEIIFYAVRPLTECYGSLSVDQFSPNKMRAVRSLMVERQWTRSNLNRAISLIRGVFGWGVSHELIPESIHAALRLVEPIPYGAEGVKESKQKSLVPDGVIELLKPYLSRQTFAILRLMWLSGARCGEICQVRPADLNRVEVDGIEIIEYTPASHKTKHKGFNRVIRLGPQATMILQPFLHRPDDSFCFSPAESEAERLAELHRLRVTPMSCGNRPGTNRKPRPQKEPGDQYTTPVVRKVLTKAIRVHNKQHPQEAIERFSPHALRHTALTRLRDRFGAEAAAAMGGHHSPSMVDLYTSRSSAAARRVAAAAG